MTKVALINPGKRLEFATAEPLNLESIASYLEKNNIEVKIIDELAGQNVKKEIEKYNPELVGITTMTPTAPHAYMIADMCRQKGIKTVIGGVHASILPQEAQKHADIVVIGEGEEAMVKIIKEDIKHGIIEAPYIKNLDDIPFPAWHLVDMNFYLTITGNSFCHHTKESTKTAALITSRGCPFSCIFCHNSWKKYPFRFNSAERVVAEIEYLIDNYNIGAVFFFDDHMLAIKPRFKKFCKLVKDKKLKFTWVCNSRVDAIDLKTLKMAYKAGCREIDFGFESGSQRILDVLNKKTTVELNRRAVKLCKKAGLMATGTFIIGNPTETVEDVRLTQKFIKENDIDFAGICMATPFPGTKLWEWCEKNNLIPKKIDWSKFVVTRFSTPIIPCTTMTPDEIKKLFDETDELISSKKTKVKLSWLLKTAVKNPIRTLRMARRSESLIKYMKRIKI